MSSCCAYEARAVGIALFASAVNPANSAGVAAFIHLITNSPATFDLNAGADVRGPSATTVLNTSDPLTSPSVPANTTSLTLQFQLGDLTT